MRARRCRCSIADARGFCGRGVYPSKLMAVLDSRCETYRLERCVSEHADDGVG
jgi:hypothetical protein